MRKVLSHHLKKPFILAIICLILIVFLSISFNFILSFVEGSLAIGNYISVFSGWFVGQIYSQNSNKIIGKKIQNKIAFYCFLVIFFYGQIYGLKNYQNKIIWTLINLFFISIYSGILYLFIGKGSRDYFKFIKQTKLTNNKKG
jgi:hypothetical protein